MSVASASIANETVLSDRSKLRPTPSRVWRLTRAAIAHPNIAQSLGGQASAREIADARQEHTYTSSAAGQPPVDAAVTAAASAIAGPGESAVAKVTEARVFGFAVEALCGERFVPQRDPTKLPMCQACKEIYDIYRAANDNLRETPNS